MVTRLNVHPQFFETVAQLIPVLLVAAAVDARGWASKESQSHGQALSEIYSLLWLTMSWVLSVYAVAVQSQNTSLFAFRGLGSCCRVGTDHLLDRVGSN